LAVAFRALDITTPWSRRVVVNGTDLGTIGSALDRVAQLAPPRITVACHGDPQPRNVLLDADLVWHLIDWEWSGLLHDWRMMVSHLVGWWYVDAVCGQPDHVSTLRAARSTLALAYEPPSVARLTPWTTPAVTAFLIMARDDHEPDLLGLTLHIAMLLMREIPRTMTLGRSGSALVLLGEAMRLIGSVSADMDHPLVAPFADLAGNRLKRAGVA
jgi:hypothetical protein